MAADPTNNETECAPAPDTVDKARGHGDEQDLNMEELESLVLKLKGALKKMTDDNDQKKDLLRRIWSLEEQKSPKKSPKEPAGVQRETPKEPAGVQGENEDHGTLDEDDKNKGTFQERTIFGNRRTGSSC